jgi:hypothetical protein
VQGIELVTERSSSCILASIRRLSTRQATQRHDRLAQVIVIMMT